MLQDPVYLHMYLSGLLGVAVFDAFTIEDTVLPPAVRLKRQRYAKRAKPTKDNGHQHPPPPSPLTPVSDWPTIVPRDTVLQCCRNYYEGTKWVMPRACAVCLCKNSC